MIAPRLPLVAPRVESILFASPARSLPLRITWQPLASPPAIGLRIIPADMNHRMVTPTIQIRAWTLRISPVGTLYRKPPRSCSNCLTDGGFHLLGNIILCHERVAKGLSLCCILCFFHEEVELGIGDLMHIQIKGR